MTTDPTDPMIGRVIDGRYAIESRIARGGMATVYVANDNRLERKVAVKVMHGHLADDANFKRRFTQEARSAARLSHPNVVNVFDQGQDAHMAYLVMEHLPGITLRDLLKQQKKLTADQASEVSEAVLAGLAAAHAAGIVHRDIKPENVLLADDGRIKLGDFGLARAASANTTTGQALLGTIAYLSPELVTRGEADARSDVYAFGVMLFEMLTGTQPFTGEQPMQIAYKHAHDEMPLPSTVTHEATPELDELVRWTTLKDPNDRPKDATVVLQRLRELRMHRASDGSLAVTQVLAAGGALITPSTTVLDDVESELLRESAVTKNQKQRAPKPRSSKRSSDRISAAQLAAAQRSKFGGSVAAVLILLAIGLGVAGWWFGQGPGSLTTVPNVAGSTTAKATATLQSVGLAATVTECSSPTVPVGSVVETQPRAGTRVEPGSQVEICESTGPRILPVPNLLGLSQADAEQAIQNAGFAFGSVTEQRFAAEAKGSVIGTTDEAGKPLPETMAENAVINLQLSAGPLPDVSGSTVSAAKSALTASGLNVDDAKQATAFSDDVPEGRVISVNAGEVLRVGDTVGLNISKGPELFAVPNVAGKTVRQAVSELSAAGFTPVVDIEERLWNAVTSTGTSPAAGTMQRRGTSITINYPR